ncbi:putative membrane insertase YidC/ALB3/OXA1/COX18, membrane insertase YidC/Oxa1 [Plasmopara halstedii]
MKVDRSLIDKNFDRYVLATDGVTKHTIELPVAALPLLNVDQKMRKAQWESRVYYNALTADPFLSRHFAAKVLYFVNAEFELVQIIDHHTDGLKIDTICSFPKLTTRQENVSVQVAGTGIIVYCDGNGTLHIVKATNNEYGAKWNELYSFAPYGVVPLLVLGAFYDESNRKVHIVVAESLLENQDDGAFRVSTIDLALQFAELSTTTKNVFAELQYTVTAITIVSKLPTCVSFNDHDVVLLLHGTYQFLVSTLKMPTREIETTSMTSKALPQKRLPDEDAVDDEEMTMLLSKIPRSGIGFHGEISRPKDFRDLASLDFNKPLSERFQKSNIPFSSVDEPLPNASEISTCSRQEDIKLQRDRPLEVPNADSILSGYEECDNGDPNAKACLVLVNLKEKVVQEQLIVDCTNFQFLCPSTCVASSSDMKAALLFRYDVHGLIFELEIASNRLILKHTTTLPAFGFVQASKQEKKIMTFHSSGSLACIGEFQRRVYVYQGTHSNKEHKSDTRQQHVIELGDEQLYGLQIVDNETILVLTSNHIHLRTTTKGDAISSTEIHLMYRMQPAKVMARSVAIRSQAARIKHMHVQFTPTRPTSSRFFSSRPITSLFNEDRIVAGSPSEEAINTTLQSVDNASSAVDFASVSDLGYSLSDLAIRSLDLIHTTTGLPWWATIIATTVAVRTAFFPMTVISMRNAAKMKLFQPDMEKLREEMDANPTRDPQTAKEFQKKYRALMKKHDVNPFKSVLTPLSQIPVFLGFFWGLQDISKYFPEYAHEGVGWVSDLSAADPTMTLPVISSALMVASVELGGDAMSSEMADKMKFGMRCFALLMIPLTMNFQSGIFVYWVTSNTFTLMQTAVMRLNAVKRALNIPVREVQRLESAMITTSSPFEAAVAHAKAGTIVKTHLNKPTKSIKSHDKK